MVKTGILIFIAILIFTSVLDLNAFLSKIVIEDNKLIEKVEFGQIDWTTGLVTIYGEKKLSEISDANPIRVRQYAKNLAYENAWKNLYNALLHLRIKNNFYIKDYLTVHTTNEFRFHYDDFLKKRAYRRFLYKEDKVIVELKVKLFQKIHDIKDEKRFIIEPINPHTNYKRYLKERGIITIFTNKYRPELIPFYSSSNYDYYIKNTLNTNNPVSQEYTSLIIDASDFKKLKPALFPALYSQSKKEIYSSRIVPEKNVVKSGMVIYLPDIELIYKFKFIRNDAFIIKAVGVRNKTDIILPDEELDQFLSNEKTVQALQKCHILVIVGK